MCLIQVAGAVDADNNLDEKFLRLYGGLFINV